MFFSDFSQRQSLTDRDCEGVHGKSHRYKKQFKKSHFFSPLYCIFSKRQPFISYQNEKKRHADSINCPRVSSFQAIPGNSLPLCRYCRIFLCRLLPHGNLHYPTINYQEMQVFFVQKSSNHCHSCCFSVTFLWDFFHTHTS